MDIIINPTNKCNFGCTFCMAGDLKNKTLTSKETIELLNKYWKEPGMLIFNGGDPLMMDPQYYADIIEYTENKFSGLTTFISLTTNLYDWYQDPLKWNDILNHERVGVITSFQYGDKRRLKNGTKYTEAKFRKVITKFQDVFNYTPDFISVVDQNNQSSIFKTANLAKELGCRCKLNKILKLGRAKNEKYLPVYRLLYLYNKIIDKSLDQYVTNIHNLKNYFSDNFTYCPICRQCYHNIRVINNDKKVFPCGNLIAHPESYKYDLEAGADESKFSKENNMIKMQCFGCENYKLCNSCRTVIAEVHHMKDEENYCKQMKKIISILREKLNDN